MKRPSILISFDIEEFDLPEEFGVSVSPQEKQSVSAEGARALLSVLEEFPAVKATFFTTVCFAESHPDLFARMTGSGHEIASHGMRHTGFHPDDLAESRRILERLSGKPVCGFRPPRLAPISKKDIADAGYRYESALNPVFLPGRYNNFRASLFPFREECGLLQIPVSAVPVIRFPLFWLSFKNIPFPLYAAGMKAAMRKTGFFNLYTHPWEYTHAAADPKWKIPGYIVRHAGEGMCRRLRMLLRLLSERGDFLTFSEFASSALKNGE